MSEQRPVAIVTGAASNIGLACAQRFAATHTVIMADIADATQQAASLPHAVAVRVNVGEFDSCLNLVAEARKYGRIDAVVHSAGITRPACSILDMPVEEWENVIKVNLTGAFFLAKACIPPMLEAGQSAMVLFSSRAAKTGFAALGSNRRENQSALLRIQGGGHLARQVAGNGACPLRNPGKRRSPRPCARNHDPQGIMAGYR